jgi:CheY-like chemotaxis protein
VVVKAAELHSGTARLYFSVRDSGIGIPAEKQKLIFESFTQADGSISRRYGGSGLGLTISSQLVRLMGGELEVDSSTGAGSIFRFAVRVPVERSVARPVLASKKVLIADRPGVSRLALENLLAELGAETTTTGNGAEALALAERTPSGSGFDAVLIDSREAGAGLANLARSLQENGAFQGKCVLMESLLDRQSRGADPDLPWLSRRIKPLRRADLAEILGGSRQPVELPESRQHGDCPPLRPGLHALVVEDHPVNQRVIAGLLKKQGYRVTVAASGEQAIACATGERFDLILMDIQMPGMSGIETTAILRSREAGSAGHCPIVALTANAMKGDREKYIAAGMDDYLSKPIRPAELYRVLSRLNSCAAPEQAANASAMETRP